MTTHVWKLVVTSLDAAMDAREVVVEADNWLAALRFARHRLGEDGGVPAGASCVMSATGEVTILDAAQRRRYELSRVAATERKPSVPPNTMAAPSTPAKRSVTIAYSPEEAAPIRQQLLAQAAQQEPNSETSAPSAEMPQHLAPPKPAAPAPVPQETSSSIARPAAATGAQPQAAPAASAKRSVTVAYLPNPVAGEGLLPVSSRDQDPSPESPLHYRERCFFTPRTLDPARLEVLLLAELSAVQESLNNAPRGKFVNMAVFDHYFHGKPERPPIATLQWKDWRGAPIFTLRDARPLPSWRPPEGPVRSTSFAPPPMNLPPAASSATGFSPLPPMRPEPAAPPQTAAAAPPTSPAAEVVAAPPPAAWPPVVLAPPAAPQPAAVPLPVAVPVPVAAPAALQVPVPAPPTPAVPGLSPAAAPLMPETRDPTGEQDRRLAVAFEATQDLYFLGTPAEALDFAVKLLGELVPSEAASGCLYDINTDEFRFVALSGPGAAERQAEAVPSSAGLLGAAAQGEREQYIANDVQREERYDPAVDGRVGLDARNIAYFPVQKNELLLGMLQLINRRGRGFSEADGAVATYVASQVAEFLSARRGVTRRR